MIIPYGWFTSEISNNRPKDIVCRTCSTKGQINVERYAVLVHVFYVPLFPIKIIDEFHCIRCTDSISYKEMIPEQKMEYKKFKSYRLPRFWHFSGVLLVLIAFLIVGFNRYNERLVVIERLSSLEENRIIELQLDDDSYSSMKVCKVHQNKTTIQVVNNTLAIEDYQRIDEITHANTYSKDTIQIDLKGLIEMAQNGKIKSVNW